MNEESYRNVGDAWSSVHPIHLTAATMLSKKWNYYFMSEVATTVARTLDICLPGHLFDRGKIIDAMESFRNTYKIRPIESNHGGAGFSNLFWLFIFIRVLRPTLIVESGVWKGQSSWLISEASLGAKIIAFDISLANLIVRAEGVTYRQGDWSESDIETSIDVNSLIHFDDHVNHARRIIQAHERGFKYLLFDDNLPAYQIFKDTPSIIPTVDMIFDPWVKNGDEFLWEEEGVIRHAIVDQAEMNVAKAKVDYWQNLPIIDPEDRANKARLGAVGKFCFLRLK